MSENQKIQKWFLHVDLDAFFASVEQLDHPEYRGKPVIVGGKPEDRRGVVSTASYEARKFGVHSAMPTFQAYRLCPHGIFVHGRMERYAELSYKIMNILKDFSPDVEQMSIDEAFLDITGTEKLFGKPEEIACKIKNRVKEETGLTISVGLAPTKYLAKLASDYNKPDGFFCIEPGKETDFMLNLPLKKVWGIGSKSLEALNKAGIKSTKDIYEKDLDLLSFMFGKNFAVFLYNSVRGIEFEAFNKPAKTHSISAETTFPYDINDIYLLETKILDLAHGVYFRLLKEECYSRTAFIKIRYDDFSTFTVRETQENNICTLDSFYETLKNLFEKKYEQGRSVRLLGVGFDNVETEEKPYQQSLFENNDKKKQKVENAILKLQKKHPEIEIKKARTIKNLILIIISSFLFVKNPSIAYSQNLHKTDSKGSAAINSEPLSQPENQTKNEVFFDWDINDKNKVDFFVSGYWKQKIESGLNFSFANSLISTPYFSTPVFSQEVDLTALITLNNIWSFEAIFAEEFEKNTFTIGYDTPFLNAKLSNRNIKFPYLYSAADFGYGLTGGNNEAPGISVHFENKDNFPLEADFLLRYEMTESCNATFYGFNQVSDYNYKPSDFVYGKVFQFPESSESITKIKNIYVEDSNGIYSDKFNRKFKKLDNTDYQILKTSGKLLLSNNANAGKKNNKIPVVLLTFENGSAEEFLSDCGSYEQPDTFLGNIQKQFSLKLEDYTFVLENQIDDEKAVCIQNRTGFSPFLCQNIYDLGIINDADIFVKSVSTEKEDNSFSADILESDFGNNFFNEKHLFAEVYKDSRFPFSKTDPQIYLSGTDTSDLEITARTYSEVSSINIGTEAIAGTITVYINGIIDSSAVYDEESGSITLSHTVNSNDKIYITWQKESSAYNTGAIAFGGGLHYFPNENFSSDFSLTSRWPLDFYSKYSTPENSLTGFTALCGGFSYSKNNFSISDKISVSFQNANSSGNLLVSYTENNNETYYNTISSGYKTLTTPILNLESDTIKLEENNNGTIENFAGKIDSSITGYKIPLEWDFSNLPDDFLCWAALDLNLSINNFNNASQFEIAILPDFETAPEIEDYKIYLQLGTKAEQEFSGEDSENIPTWFISEKGNKCLEPLDISKNEWQIVKINLSDSDRAKLSSDSDLRLIVLKKQKQNTSSKGILYAGPYEPYFETCYVTADENILVNTSSISQKSPSSETLSLKENYSTTINWIVSDEAHISENNSQITVEKYFSQSDFSDYKTINIDYKFNFSGIHNHVSESTGDFCLILDTGAENSEEALNLTLFNFFNLFNKDEKFHTLSININEKTVLLDNEPLSETDYILSVNKNVIPNHEKIIFDTLNSSSLFTSGTFYMDNLYYSHSSSKISFQNKIDFNYKKEGPIAAVKNFNILENYFLKAESSQTESAAANGLSEFNSFFDSSVQTGIDIASINTQAEVNTKYSNNDVKFIQSAGHNIKTSKAVFKIFNFEEDYKYNYADNQLSKKNYYLIDFNNINAPVKLSCDFISTEGKYLQKQNSKLAFDVSVPLLNCKFNFNSNLAANQKTKETLVLNSYFEDWLNITKSNFSLGKETASTRQIVFNNSLGLKIPFADLYPNFLYKIESCYKNSSTVNYSDTTTLNFILPFSLGNNNFSFEINRETSENQLTEKGGNYISDCQKYFSHFENNLYFYTSIPFYELFNKNLKSYIFNAGANILSLENNSFSTKYEFSWKRKLYNSLVDFFIPASSQIAISRNINSAADISDYYQIKSVISNSCVNIFGKQSKLKIFKFYNTDEYLSSITTIVKIPSETPENTTFGIAAYSQSIFYLTNTDTLKQGLNFSIDTDSNWNFNSLTTWNHSATTSPLQMLLKLIPDKNNSKMKISEKENLNILIQKTSSNFKQIYSFDHKDEVDFLKYYSAAIATGASFTSNSNSSDLLNFTLTISGKMEF